MSFEFISNPIAKYNNFEFAKNLIKTSTESNGYLYQPNFVLISGSRAYGSSNTLFGDILPVYSSARELTNIIVTSWESLANLVVLSKTFIVCLLSLMNTVIHNTVYQAYTLLVAAYGQVIQLPGNYGRVKNKLENLIEVFSTQQGRELWWIEVRIDVNTLLSKAYGLMSLILDVSKKFYLAWLVFIVIGFLNYSAVFSNFSEKPNSFLSKFIQNYSLTASASPVLDMNSGASSLSTPYVANEVPQIQAITEYVAEDGDNVQQVAYKFGVSPETIKLNNNIKDEIVTGQKIYVPWIDGYIYSASRDIAPQDLEKIYSVSADEIKNQNISIFDGSISAFHKDSLVLIPTNDFTKIDKGNQFLASQKQSIEQSKRSKTLSENSIAYQKKTVKTDNFVASNQSATGFIWPTTGNISRCFSSIHHGCDIANFSAPLIHAAKGGVVKVGYEAGGYGNFVKIDHGNGVLTVYAHMKEIYVSTGQIVAQGDTLGQMGATGHATGIHLHFEVQIDGVQLDPLRFLPSR